MTEAEFRIARAVFLKSDELDARFMPVLRSVVVSLVKFGNLPEWYSPTGSWGEESVDEIMADWTADRLVGTGQLRRILHEAGSLGSFKRIGEEAVRRNLIDRLERSQARNIYARVRKMLTIADEFENFAGDHWRLTESGSNAWQGSDRDLLSVAWGLGEFTTITYREDAKKLSPLLEAPELKRYLVGLLSTSKSALSLSEIIETISSRFDLGAIETTELVERDVVDPEPSPHDQVLESRDLERDVAFVLGELSARQREVLRCQLDGATTREVAPKLGISTGTVSAEQSAIAAILARMSDPDGENRGELLNALRDALFKS